MSDEDFLRQAAMMSTDAEDDEDEQDSAEDDGDEGGEDEVSENDQ